MTSIAEFSPRGRVLLKENYFHLEVEANEVLLALIKRQCDSLELPASYLVVEEGKRLQVAKTAQRDALKELTDYLKGQEIEVVVQRIAA